MPNNNPQTTKRRRWHEIDEAVEGLIASEPKTTPLKRLYGEELQNHIDFEPLQVAHRLRRYFELWGAKENTDYFISPLPKGRGLEFFYLTEKGKLAFASLKESVIVCNDGEIA